MEKTKYVNLPLAGTVQHGIMQENGVPTELGYFITKIKDIQLDLLGKKFNKVFGEKPTKIKIRFFSENPFTIKNARYNQGGVACYCLLGEKNGKQKVKNKWEDKECLPTCEHAISKNGQKPACVEEGVLKFLIPDISLDRVWILRIRGITVINKINNYIEYQRLIGNSIKGDFYLYLTKEKQTRAKDGYSFNNFVVKLLKEGEDEANSDVQTEDLIEKLEEKSTIVEQKVDKVFAKNDSKQNKNSKTKKENKKEESKVEEQKIVSIAPIETAKDGEYEMEDCYCFLGYEPIVINKNGQKLNYIQGNFMDMKDNPVSAIMNENLTNELKECDIGTVLELKFLEKLDKKWIVNCKFIQKCIKKVAV